MSGRSSIMDTPAAMFMPVLRLHGHRLQGDREPPTRTLAHTPAPTCRRQSHPHRLPPTPPGAVWSAQQRPKSVGRLTWRRCRAQVLTVPTYASRALPLADAKMQLSCRCPATFMPPPGASGHPFSESGGASEREEERRCLSAARPSWFCPNGKPDEGEYSQAENDNRNRGHFGDGKPSCHAPVSSAVERRR
jgi:hypothetical protein